MVLIVCGMEFFVEGTPVPQGSKTIMGAKTGRPWLTDGSGEKPKALKAWRNEIGNAAFALGEFYDGPVEVWLRFVFVKPKSVKREFMSVAQIWIS